MSLILQIIYYFTLMSIIDDMRLDCQDVQSKWTPQQEDIALIEAQREQYHKDLLEAEQHCNEMATKFRKQILLKNKIQ